MPMQQTGSELPDAQRRQALAVIIMTTTLALPGCDRGATLSSSSSASASGRGAIDAEWHRRTLVDGLLARWLRVSTTPSGMFLTRLDRQWQPLGRDSVDLTTQSRLIYSMAIGYELSRDPRYLAAARQGGDFLLTRLRDPVHGGFFNSVSADGKVIADHKGSYGHAFAILALATLARVDDDDAGDGKAADAVAASAPGRAPQGRLHKTRWLAAALRAWDDVALGLREPGGGLYGEATRGFAPQVAGNRSQNPLMHMFEALLALLDASSDAANQARVAAAARKLGDFVVYRLLEGRADGSARIPEWYDADWKPLPTSEGGGYIDLGHQFEWTHLLIGAAERGISPIYASVAERLLQYAQEKGYDEREGGAYGRAFPDKDSIDRGKGEWQQYECLHCFIAVASSTSSTSSGRPEMWRRYEQTLGFVKTELIGGKDSAPGCRQVSCAEERLDPYHMTSMHLAAIRAAGA